MSALNIYPECAAVVIRITEHFAYWSGNNAPFLVQSISVTINPTSETEGITHRFRAKYATWWPCIRAGQIFFRVEWVELVVKLTKLSHWGLVPGHLLQNWSCAFDLKFENFPEFFCLGPSQYSTWHVSFASYRHNKLAVDGSNAHTNHAHYTDGIVSLTFTSKFFARPGFLVWSCSQ